MKHPISQALQYEKYGSTKGYKTKKHGCVIDAFKRAVCLKMSIEGLLKGV